jgi:hypothetical protein
VTAELELIETTLHRVACERAARWRGGRRRRRLLATAAAIACLAVTSIALAGARPLIRLIPGFSVTASPPVASSDLTAAMSPSLTPVPASPRVLQSLQSFGFDLAQLHRVRSQRFGVTVFIAPRTTGGTCVLYVLPGTSFGQCGDEASLENGGWISRSDGSRLWVGLRPDGVESVTAVDGTVVPVIDNVYISDREVASALP